jgi:hypothetical protein
MNAATHPSLPASICVLEAYQHKLTKVALSPILLEAVDAAVLEDLALKGVLVIHTAISMALQRRALRSPSHRVTIGKGTSL